MLEAFVHPYACGVGLYFVLMDENACPHRACVVNEFIELYNESNVPLRNLIQWFLPSHGFLGIPINSNIFKIEKE